MKELFLAPLKGLAFCVFLPAIGFVLLAVVIVQRLRMAGKAAARR